MSNCSPKSAIANPGKRLFRLVETDLTVPSTSEAPPNLIPNLTTAIASPFELIPLEAVIGLIEACKHIVRQEDCLDFTVLELLTEENRRQIIVQGNQGYCLLITHPAIVAESVLERVYGPVQQQAQKALAKVCNNFAAKMA